jgi:alkyl hydroperoxide reductase subunit AhpC
MDSNGKHSVQDSFCAQTNDPAPTFSAEAFFNSDKKIRTISLNELRGKWVVLFFYGSDFTFV